MRVKNQAGKNCNPRKKTDPSDLETVEKPRIMSKHERRRHRRSQYFEMIDKAVNMEKSFRGRVIDVINHEGIGIAPDGKPIKADWWEYMASREKRRRNTSLACLYLLSQTIESIRPKLAM